MIFTALKEEHRAVDDHLRDRAQHINTAKLADGTYAEVYLLDGEASWVVYLVDIGPGNNNAAVLAERYREALHLDSLVFVGVAAGRKDVRLGDVVIAEKVYAYESGRQSEGEFQARPDVWKAPHRTVQAAKQARRALERRGVGYSIQIKAVSSGSAVVDAHDAPAWRTIHTHYEDTAALEMEGAGLATAAHLAEGVQAFIIRGISDRGDGHKKAADAKRWQERAAANAAEVAVAALAALTPSEPGHSAPVTTAASPLRQEESESPRGTEPDGEPGRAAPPSTAPVAHGLSGPPLDPPDHTPRVTGGRRRWPWVAGPSLALAVVLGLVLQSCGSGDANPHDGRTLSAPTLPSCDKADVTLHIASSVDKSESLRRAAKEYGNRVGAGQCVGIDVKDKNSGDAMRALVRGWSENDGDEPDVWSPAGNTWLTLARATATGKNARLFPEHAESIVQSPLTIAMPEPMARVLEWPETRFEWTDLADWAKNADGFWAKRGKPEWGDFKLGKTNPGYSTSGLNASVGAFFAKTGASRELGVKHLDDSANRAFVKSIEQAAVHYGDTTLTFTSNLRHADRSSPEKAMSYISAVTLEENTVAAYNAGYPCGALSADPDCAKTDPPDTPLVSFYPKDGVPFSDHPYIELKGTGRAKKAVADDFLRYLQSPDVFAEHFAPYGFRTQTGKVPENSPLKHESSGALPEEDFKRMPMPDGDVLERLMRIWPGLRRPANVLVVIDTSESMNDEIPGTGDTKIGRLKGAESKLFGKDSEFTGTDRVGLWKFSDAEVLDGRLDYKELVAPGPYHQKLAGGTRADLLSENFRHLEPEGATGLYDTLDAALKDMREGYDPKAINAIVLLTDGRNEDNGSLEKDELLKRISDPQQPQVRVFTIAYGDEADDNDKNGRSVLQEIADAGGGQMYDARRAQTIEQVLTSVISNF
jgi:Ca-activated chloride channel homolog